MNPLTSFYLSIAFIATVYTSTNVTPVGGMPPGGDLWTLQPVGQDFFHGAHK